MTEPSSLTSTSSATTWFGPALATGASLRSALTVITTVDLWTRRLASLTLRLKLKRRSRTSCSGAVKRGVKDEQGLRVRSGIVADNPLTSRKFSRSLLLLQTCPLFSPPPRYAVLPLDKGESGLVASPLVAHLWGQVWHCCWLISAKRTIHKYPITVFSYPIRQSDLTYCHLRMPSMYKICHIMYINN